VLHVPCLLVLLKLVTSPLIRNQDAYVTGREFLGTLARFAELDRDGSEHLSLEEARP
jgi:hypothetical protein